jgi:hypothetical protein
MMFLKKIASVLLIVGFALIGVPQAASATIPIMDVVASSDDGNVAENTIDGDYGTRWSAKGDGQWIRYEFELCDTVAFVGIAFHQGDKRVAFFDIEVSDDGENWTFAYRGESSGNSLEANVFELHDIPACFVRIVGYGNSRNVWNSITEVGFSSPIDDELAPPGPLPVLDVWASSDDGDNIAENTLDRDLGTRWSAKGSRHRIDFKLGEGNPPDDQHPRVNKVSIAWHQGNRRSAAFSIQVSLNGEDWIHVYGGFSSGTTLGLESYTFNTVHAKWVRIVGLGNSNNPWTSITEVEFRHGDFLHPPSG